MRWCRGGRGIGSFDGDCGVLAKWEKEGLEVRMVGSKAISRFSA